MDWLQEITASLAERTDVDPETIALDPDRVRAILDVARVAAHASGARINAPLLCYVLGMLDARGVPLERSATIVTELAGPVEERA